jgi:hypothetical protein
MKRILIFNENLTCVSLISILFFVLFSCEKATKANDINLNPDEALYSFVFYDLDEKMLNQWVAPHLSGLHGKRLNTITQKGALGKRTIIIVTVKIDDRVKTLDDLKELNIETLNSLSSRAKYDLEFRLGS